MRFALAVGGVAVVAACAKSPERPSSTAAFHAIDSGSAVPALTLASLDGDSARIGPGQRTTLLNVWATWCTSCREEMALLDSLDHEFAASGLRVVAVSVDRGDVSRVRRFVATSPAPKFIAHQGDGTFEETMHIPAVPTTVLIDSTGTVRWVRTGSILDASAPIRTAIRAALRH